MQSSQHKNNDPFRIQPKKTNTLQKKANQSIQKKGNPFKNALQTSNHNYFQAALNSTSTIQPKLQIGQSNDRYEQEADHIANQVVNNSIQKKSLASKVSPASIQMSSQDNTASNHIESQINKNKGGGSPLDTQTQSFMGNSFGTDFSQVRIHTGMPSIQMNQELGAKAFTFGNDIFFNQGQYNPGSKDGQKLLAHELTHTIQQSGKLTSSIQKDDDDDKKTFQFDYKLLPPELQLRLGRLMLQADTSRTELSYTHRLLRFNLGYNYDNLDPYGGHIYAGAQRGGFGTQFGYNPSNNNFRLNLSQNQYRFNFSGNPSTRDIGFGFGYGAPLLPMPDQLSQTVYAGAAGLSGIASGLSDFSDPLSFYMAQSENKDAVMRAVKMLQPLANPDSTRFGAGIQFTYNPVTGFLIRGGLQWRF